MDNVEHVAFLIDRTEDGRLAFFQESVQPNAEVVFIVNCPDTILIEGPLECNSRWPCEMPGQEETRAVAPGERSHYKFRLRSDPRGLRTHYHTVAVAKNGVKECCFVVDIVEVEDEDGSVTQTLQARLRKFINNGSEALIVFDNRTGESVKVEVISAGATLKIVDCKPWLNTFRTIKPNGDGVVLFSLSGIINPDPTGRKQPGGTDQADIIFP